MKKTIIALVSFMLVQIMAIAQVDNQASQPKKSYLPEAGDFAVGLDARPFLHYFGNMFNGTTNNNINFANNNIFLKYFIMDEAAVRLSFNIDNVDKIITNRYVPDDNARINDPLSRQEVIDRQIQTSERYTVRAGYQHYLGEERLRGFVGGDLGYTAERTHLNYEYGNVMNEVNPNPTTANFMGGEVPFFNPMQRHTEIRTNITNLFFVSAFTGVEYFVIPMLSLGLEVGLQYGQEFEGQRYRKYETVVGQEVIPMEQTIRANQRARYMGSSVPVYGFLTINFHF